jgi:CRISPR-associated protein Cas2
MTIVVTRNSPDRIRGFLASCMCEIAPGVYTSPRMTAGIRERVWKVLSGWYKGEADHSVLMTWSRSDVPGGQEVRALGVPKQDLSRYGGVYLARREADEKALGKLKHRTGFGQSGPHEVA